MLIAQVCWWQTSFSTQITPPQIMSDVRDVLPATLPDTTAKTAEAAFLQSVRPCRSYRRLRRLSLLLPGLATKQATKSASLLSLCSRGADLIFQYTFPPSSGVLRHSPPLRARSSARQAQHLNAGLSTELSSGTAHSNGSDTRSPACPTVKRTELRSSSHRQVQLTTGFRVLV